MATSFEVFTLDEARKKGAGWLWPADGSMEIMPRATWRMIDANPDHPGDMPVAATLSVDGRRTYSIALSNQTIEYTGKHYPCVWGRALQSDPDVGVAGLGGMFMLRVMDVLRRRHIAFASYGANPAAVNLYRALRLAEVGRSQRCVLPVGGRSIARKYLPVPVAADLAGGVLSAALATRAAWYGRHHRAVARQFHLSVDEVTHCDVVSYENRAHIVRSPRMIEWKLRCVREVSGASSTVLSLHREDGRQAAFLMLRFATHPSIGRRGFPDARMCRVMDFVTDGSEGAAIGAVCHLIQVCRQQLVDFIEVVTTDRNIQRVCETLGFIRSNGYNLLLTSNGKLPDALFGIDAWFLNMMESDPAFF